MEQGNVCRSVFVSGGVTREGFTRLWIEMVSRIEARRAACGEDE